jgi:hypothetical protein
MFWPRGWSYKPFFLYGWRFRKPTWEWVFWIRSFGTLHRREHTLHCRLMLYSSLVPQLLLWTPLFGQTEFPSSICSLLCWLYTIKCEWWIAYNVGGWLTVGNTLVGATSSFIDVSLLAFGMPSLDWLGIHTCGRTNVKVSLMSRSDGAFRFYSLQSYKIDAHPRHR